MCFIRRINCFILKSYKDLLNVFCFLKKIGLTFLIIFYKYCYYFGTSLEVDLEVTSPEPSA